MYIYCFHLEVRVASGDCRVVIFARIRIDNLPVHLDYNDTSNRSRINLQLIKSYKDVNEHEESVRWLEGTCRFRCVSHNNSPEIQLSENAMQS